MFSLLGCVSEREAAVVLTNDELDMFIPDCAGSGNYRALQSDAANRTFWCVDPGTGVEIEGTRRDSTEEEEVVCEGDLFYHQGNIVHSFSNEFPHVEILQSLKDPFLAS